MEAFHQGGTVEVLVYVYTHADVLAAQDGLTITINKPDGTEALAATSMDNDAVGTYSYNYSLATDADKGVWTVSVKATSNSDYTIQNDLFKVVTAI